MIDKNHILTLTEEALEEKESLFLIDCNISTDNKITVIVDGYNGVTISDCIDISRFIENHLDREETDFSLEVTSPGATEPLVDNRQYKKNIGRTLSVKTTTDTLEGVLTNCDENGITVEWKTREPKEVGKGKTTVIKKADVPYSEIKQAKVKIIF